MNITTLLYILSGFFIFGFLIALIIIILWWLIKIRKIKKGIPYDLKGGYKNEKQENKKIQEARKKYRESKYKSKPESESTATEQGGYSDSPKGEWGIPLQSSESFGYAEQQSDRDDFNAEQDWEDFG